MKKLLFLVIFVLLFFAGRVEANNWGRGVSFNYFYTTLSPYGEWIELDDGLYAWQPYGMSSNWQPYSIGRWVWSEYGWYWDSFEPFGWAVYHYGRWYNDDYYGWIWIPDYDWGPSWVEWRYNDDYIGWAPLPPYAVFRPGIGIHFTIDWHFPVRYWNYVRCDHFYDYEVHRYLIPDRVKYRVYNETRYRTNYDYRDGRVINRGIDRDFVERRSGRPVTERNIVETSRLRDFEGSRSSGSRRDRVEVFRPSQQDINTSRDVSKIDIKRSDRRTSLDLSKVERQRENSDRRIEPTAKERDRIEGRNTQIIPDTRRNQDNQIKEMEKRQGQEPRRRSEFPGGNPRSEVQQNPEGQQQSDPRINRNRREESRDTEQRREMPSYQNHPKNDNQQPPQVRERRVEERKVEERRSDDRRQDTPRENRREDRQSRENGRERSR